jgi:hypothetical protein
VTLFALGIAPHDEQLAFAVLARQMAEGVQQDIDALDRLQPAYEEQYVALSRKIQQGARLILRQGPE